jgi:hypothetical protein
MDVPPALFGERPLVNPVRSSQELPEEGAQIAGAAGGKLDRPVAVLALGACEPGAQPCRAVFAAAENFVITSKSDGIPIPATRNALLAAGAKCHTLPSYIRATPTMAY